MLTLNSLWQRKKKRERKLFPKQLRYFYIPHCFSKANANIYINTSTSTTTLKRIIIHLFNSVLEEDKSNLGNLKMHLFCFFEAAPVAVLNHLVTNGLKK